MIEFRGRPHCGGSDTAREPTCHSQPRIRVAPHSLGSLRWMPRLRSSDPSRAAIAASPREGAGLRRPPIPGHGDATCPAARSQWTLTLVSSHSFLHRSAAVLLALTGSGPCPWLTLREAVPPSESPVSHGQCQPALLQPSMKTCSTSPWQAQNMAAPPPQPVSGNAFATLLAY